MIFFDVYLSGNLLETHKADETATSESFRRNLVNLRGYNPRVTVAKRYGARRAA